MTSIRTHIMNRKVQWSVTRCAQCSRFARACGLPCLVPCRRLCVLVKGRLYYRWLCQHCIEATWGTVSPSSTLLSRLCEEQTPAGGPPSTESVDQPFRRGMCIGLALLKHGILDHLDLTNAQGCHVTASQYAESAYPLASVEDHSVLIAGILHAWATAHTDREGTR
jgi:hypothetical protein